MAPSRTTPPRSQDQLKWSDLIFLALAIAGGIFLGNIYGYTNAGRDVANNCIIDQAFEIQGRVFDCEEHVPPTPAKAAST